MTSIPRVLVGKARLSTGLPALSWRTVTLAVYVALNLGLSLTVDLGPGSPDWRLWESLPAAIADGRMYSTGTEAPFVWSPIAGYAMQYVPVLGYWPWVAVHVGAVVLLRDWRLIGLVLVSFGFWHDVIGGNLFTFVFVSGALALRGSRWAALVYLALLLLMPRPVQLPLAALLLYRDRSLWVPFAAMFLAHALAVLWSGYAEEWIAAMLAHGAPHGNIAPSEIIGVGPWLIVGVPLGAWLLWRGHVGWASLAVSPYWLWQYLLMPLLEIRPAARSSSRG